MHRRQFSESLGGGGGGTLNNTFFILNMIGMKLNFQSQSVFVRSLLSMLKSESTKTRMKETGKIIIREFLKYDFRTPTLSRGNWSYVS